MKRILISVLSALLLTAPTTGALFAQTKRTGAQKAQKVKEERSLLWKISGNGLEKPSYLFGTIHLICKDDLFWTDAMQQALEASEKVCFELDVTDMKTQMAIGMGMLIKDDRTLRDYFEQEDYDKFEAYASEHFSQVPMEALNKMQPFAVSTLFIQEFYPCDEVLSYEAEIAAKIAGDGKPVLAVEDPEDQLAAMLSSNADSVVATINQFVNGGAAVDSMKGLFGDMMTAYKQQDLSAIEKLTREQSSAMMDMDIFLYQRNGKWIPKMSDYMKDGAVFFAVGAAHLPGEKGVISLLRKAGYTLEPVK